ncbi:MAG: T9SS type A sorting domain-containing protein [Prevotella sp.]|nr:T9SS type A sorting domain-containing protein [Prevotella sp.]
MIKKIFTLLLLSVLVCGFPLSASAVNAFEAVENEFEQVNVSVTGSSLHVTGANGDVLYIYNVAGVRVWSARVEGSDRTYQLNLPKGCYIVKVGKTVRKISIR